MTIKNILFFLSISALSSCSSQKMDLDRTFHDVKVSTAHSDSNWNMFYVLGGTASDWYNSTTGFNTEIMVLIHYNHSANTRQIYPFITKYSLKSTVCRYVSIPPIDGVAYQATPGNKFKVEACDNNDTTDLGDDFLKANSIDDSADWTRIYNNRGGDTTLSPDHTYLQIEEAHDVTVGAATYTRYKMRIDDSAHYVCEDINITNIPDTPDGPSGANPGLAMFIPARVEASGTSIDYAGEYYKSLKLDVYNADHISYFYDRRDVSVWSYVCDHRPTDCLLAQNGVSTASAPALLNSSTIPDYVDAKGTWQFSADRDFNNCANTGCSNGTQDNTELDVDCGGDACSKCGTGQKCNSPSDCASNSCELSGGRDFKVCQDGHTMGANTPLPVSSPCNLSNNGADCYSGHCEANVSYPTLGNCRIGWFNDPCQNITDCLSNSCHGYGLNMRCAEGNSGAYCDSSNPCISGICTNNVCAQGNNGARCWANSDCTTSRCVTEHAGVSGYCQLKTGGAACNSNSECFSGSCGSKKKCATLPPVAACWQHTDCTSRSCAHQDYETPAPGSCN